MENTNKAIEALKKMKGLGIAAAIFLILLGICMFIKPLATSAFMIWLLVIGVLISGIEKIVSYFKMPKDERDGFLLAAGLLWLFTSIFIISRGCGAGFATTAIMEVCIAMMIGFTCLFSGIGRICYSGKVKEAGGSSGLAIFSGILDILCGLAVLSAPLAGLFTITFVFGIYMLVVGVSLLVRCLSL